MNKAQFFVMTILLCIASCKNGEDKNHITNNETLQYISEGRGVWIDNPDGLDWMTVMEKLRNNGINMVFPEMCSSGAAFYNSKYLPMISDIDELTACIRAAHKHDIEVHVWKMNWNLYHAPDSITEKMSKQKRIQLSHDGKRVPTVSKELGWNQKWDWLCPSVRENQQLEYDVMVEIAENYDVDGVHFDYMRYPYEPFCYCENCKKNFQQQTGVQIVHWPDEVWKRGEYHEKYKKWRSSLITETARRISEKIHSLNIYICVSLAARSGVEHAINSDAQLWWEWTKEGILDFVCPMNYTANPNEYAAMMKAHYAIMNTNVPYYGGVGLFEMRQFEPFQQTIHKGRQLGQDGFVIFSLEWGGLMPLLDEIGEKITVHKKALLPHRSPGVTYNFLNVLNQLKESFPVFPVNNTISLNAEVKFEGKFRNSVDQITGDFYIEDLYHEKLKFISSIDAENNTLKELIVNPEKKDTFQISLYGHVTFTNNEKKPFIAKSFPFVVN